MRTKHRRSAPTLATLGAGNDGTSECAERLRTLVGRSSEQDCTARPCAPARWKTATLAGQVVDTRVVERPDKCDGSEKAWPNWSFVMKAYAGAIRPGAVDGHDRCSDEYGCVEQRKHDESQEVQDCAVVFRLDHVVHWHSSGPHRTCSAWQGHGAYHEGNGPKLELERVNGFFELLVDFVPYSQSTSKNSTSGTYSSLSALEQTEDMMVRIASVDHPN